MAIAVGEANAALDAIFVTPATEVALHTADPGAAGTANEVVGGSYSRVVGQFSTGASGGSVSSDADMSFTAMPEVTVTHISVWETGGGAAFHWSAALDSSVALPAGATFTISSGDATFSIT